MNGVNNVDILKEAYQKWNDNKQDSFEHWMDLMADNVQLNSIANGVPGMEFTRTCLCKSDVLRYFTELAAVWEMLHYTAEEFISEGERVVMIGRCGWRNRNTGKIVETPKVDIIRMKDSKIVEFYELFDTEKARCATLE